MHTVITSMKLTAHTRVSMVACVLGLLVAGCGGGGATTVTQSPRATTPSATSTAAPTTSDVAPTTTDAAASGPDVSVYFMSDDATTLDLASKPGPTTDSPLRAAMLVLAEGPFFPGALPALPSGTTVVGTNISGGEATVNFSREFASGYPSGGAAAEAAVIAPIVFTATEIKGVERVRITVDGATPELAGSQYDWSRPFTRGDFPDLKIDAG